MMESSKLIDGITFLYDTTGFGLYFGKYAYKAKMVFKAVGLVRYYKTVDQFDLRLDQTMYSYWNNNTNCTLRNIIGDDGGDVLALKKFINWKNNDFDKTAKIVTTRNTITFYFNKINTIKSFQAAVGKYNTACSWRQKTTKYKRGVVYHKNPTHKWRILMHANYINAAEFENFEALLTNYDIKACPTILRTMRMYHNNRLTSPGFYIHQNNFLDVNDERITTLIALQFPRLIKKICTIERK